MSRTSQTKKLTKIISGEGKLHKLGRGDVIQSTDDAKRLILIKHGFVKKYLILNDGSIRVQILYGPGDIFPLTIVFKKILDQDLYTGPETYYYEAMSDTQIWTLDQDDMAHYISKDPLLYRELLSEAGRRLNFNIMVLENLGLPNSYKRVAHLTAFLASEFGEKRLLGTRVNVPVTRQDLADILSMTRETVSLCMTQLKNEGLIRPGKNLVVPDVKRLEKEAFK